VCVVSLCSLLANLTLPQEASKLLIGWAMKEVLHHYHPVVGGVDQLLTRSAATAPRSTRFATS
jgi:hypothetical protein